MAGEIIHAESKLTQAVTEYLEAIGYTVTGEVNFSVQETPWGTLKGEFTLRSYIWKKDK